MTVPDGAGRDKPKLGLALPESDRIGPLLARIEEGMVRSRISAGEGARIVAHWDELRGSLGLPTDGPSQWGTLEEQHHHIERAAANGILTCADVMRDDASFWQRWHLSSTRTAQRLIALFKTTSRDMFIGWNDSGILTDQFVESLEQVQESRSLSKQRRFREQCRIQGGGLVERYDAMCRDVGEPSTYYIHGTDANGRKMIMRVSDPGAQRESRPLDRLR